MPSDTFIIRLLMVYVRDFGYTNIRAAGNITCYGPLQAERANVVIKLFVIIKLIILHILVHAGTQRNSTIF